MNRKTLGLIALPVAAVIGLAGCGNGNSAASSADPGHSDMPGMSSGSMPTTHNDQDVMFAQQMIPHHEQALEMAKLARQRAGSTEVKQLAAKIEAAQDPEITTMTGWLKAWEADNSTAGMAGMDHGSDMPGMMSKSQMATLDKIRGEKFDEMFLRGMIAHHEGAVTMADDEIGKGENPDAVALAKRIKAAQAAEIQQMQDLLAS